MIAPKKSKLTNPFSKTLPAIEIELDWDFDKEGNSEGIYRCNDYHIQFGEFNLVVDMYVREIDKITNATRIYPAEQKQLSLTIHVDKIKMYDYNHERVALTNFQHELLKRNIISSIQTL